MAEQQPVQMVVRHEHVFEWMTRVSYLAYSDRRGTPRKISEACWGRMASHPESFRQSRDGNTNELIIAVCVEIRENMVGEV